MYNTVRSLVAPCLALAASATDVSAQPTKVPTWRVVSDLTIFGAKEDIDRLIAPMVTRSGTIAVGDNQNGMVSMYDSTGRRIARSGGKGRGPGEVTEFHDEGRGLVGDSIWFYDWSQRRVVVYSAQGKAVRTTAVPSAVTTQGRTIQRITALTPRALLGNGGMIISGLSWIEAAAWQGSVTLVGILSPANVVTKVLATGNDSSSIVRVGGTYSLVVPYAFGDITRTSLDGSYVLHLTAQPSRDDTHLVKVTVFRSNGDVAYSLRHSIAAERIPDSVLTRARDSQLDRARRRGYESDVRERFLARLPRTYPSVTDAVVTREGRAWLRLRPRGQTVTYLSIGPGGTLEGVISMPRAATVFDGFGDRLWATTEDANGFVDITRYKLLRR